MSARPVCCPCQKWCWSALEENDEALHHRPSSGPSNEVLALPDSHNPAEDEFIEMPDFVDAAVIDSPLQQLDPKATQACVRYLWCGSSASIAWQRTFADIAQVRSLVDLHLDLAYGRQMSQDDAPDFGRLVAGACRLRTLRWTGAYTTPMLETGLAGLEQQTELQFLQLASQVDVPVNLLTMLSQGHLRRLRYLALVSLGAVLATETWDLPQLEYLSLDVYQAELRLGRLSSLRAVHIRAAQRSIAIFGTVRHRLRKLRLDGDVEIEGSIRPVRYLAMQSHPSPERIVRLCPNLVELFIRGGRSRRTTRPDILLPRTLQRLALIDFSVRAVQQRPDHTLDVLILSHVAVLNKSTKINARHVFLQGNRTLFFEQFSQPTSALLGSPESLVLVQDDSDDWEGFARNDVNESILLKGGVRTQLRLFMTNIPLSSPLSRIDRLEFLGLAAYRDVLKVPAGLATENLLGFAVYLDDGEFSVAQPRLASLCGELWVDHAPTSKKQAFPIITTTVAGNYYGVWMRQIGRRFESNDIAKSLQPH